MLFENFSGAPNIFDVQQKMARLVLGAFLFILLLLFFIGYAEPVPQKKIVPKPKKNKPPTKSNKTKRHISKRISNKTKKQPRKSNNQSKKSKKTKKSATNTVLKTSKRKTLHKKRIGKIGQRKTKTKANKKAKNHSSKSHKKAATKKLVTKENKRVSKKATQRKNRKNTQIKSLGKTFKAQPKQNKTVPAKPIRKKNVKDSVMPPVEYPQGSYGAKQDPKNYAVFGPKDDRAISNVFSSTDAKPVSGVFDVITHGFKDGTLMNSQRGQSSPEEFAKWILENTNYKPGTPIRLLVCHSGAKNEQDPKQLAMAQKVANALGTTVYGANTYVSANRFDPVVMPDQPRDKEYRWGFFEPGNKAKEVPQPTARKLSEEQVKEYTELGNDLDAYAGVRRIEELNGSPMTTDQSKNSYKLQKEHLDEENKFY